MMPLLKGVSSIFNLGLSFNAMGNAFAKEGLMKYAKGGVVSEPTFFRYGAAGNLGLMGEAGSPEQVPVFLLPTSLHDREQASNHRGRKVGSSKEKQPPCKLDPLQTLALVVQVQVEGAGEQEWQLNRGESHHVE